MKYIQKRPQSSWVSIGYQAAKMNIEFDAIKSNSAIANEWIRQGMERWRRRVTRLDMNRKQGQA